MTLRSTQPLALLDWNDCLLQPKEDDSAELFLPMLVSIDCELEDAFLTTNRSRSDSGDVESSSVTSVESPVAAKANPTTAKRTRKRTYELRKDEVSELDSQAKQLSAILDSLKHRAGIPVQQTSLAQQTINNLMLREVLRNQQLLAVGFRSLMTADTSEFVVSPISSRIHLMGDLDKRLQLLRGLKQQKLHDARRFLETRTHFLPKTTRVSESTKRQFHNGDNVSIRLDIAPLPHAKSVKQVYDDLQYFFANLETCMDQILGDVTAREESATRPQRGGNSSIAQHRFLYTSQRKFQVESNSVVFSEYTPKSGDRGEECIFASDFVDQDDLFPFAPQSRMHKDHTCILHIQSCERPQQQQNVRSTSPSADRNKSEQVVVLTMWFYTKLHRCDFAIPEERLLELIEGTDRVHEAILKAVRALLR
ncbi:hypothetical protein Gpo141_00011886, partial [Globisporangium polare]